MKAPGRQAEFGGDDEKYNIANGIIGKNDGIREKSGQTTLIGPASLIMREEDAGRRLDIVLAEREGLSRSAAVRLIERGSVRISGAGGTGKSAGEGDVVTDKNHRVRAGERAIVDYPPPEPSGNLPEDICLDIIYEDDCILVVNKPSGMVVHPAAGNLSGTLVNALLHHCGDSLSGIGGVARPGIVHRIDKDTSGLLAVAKTDSAHINLSAQLRKRSMKRVYHAILTGNLRRDEGKVDAYIGRHPVNRKRMAILPVNAEGVRRAVTHFRVLERFKCAAGSFTYAELELETGRTHQIRVHMAGLGHPLLGDKIYGGGRTMFEKINIDLLRGQCLHAKKLLLKHPETGEDLLFECELPTDFEVILGKLGSERI